jgi:hypothetical protein
MHIASEPFVRGVEVLIARRRGGRLVGCACVLRSHQARWHAVLTELASVKMIVEALPALARIRRNGGGEHRERR